MKGSKRGRTSKEGRVLYYEARGWGRWTSMREEEKEELRGRVGGGRKMLKLSILIHKSKIKITVLPFIST